jgi:surfactin synthase thioesterase subunit
MTLFIFPHAGGAPKFYVPFAKAFTSDVKRIAVQYPGRGGSHDLGSFRTIPDLAERVAGLLPAQIDGQVAFFGHSMGSLVAFEVARRFEAEGRPISALFVSATAAPGRIGSEYIPESDRGLLEAVATMTGVNPEFLENEEFAARILPTLRGFKAIMAYQCPPDATVSCPIAAYLGDEDEIRRTSATLVGTHDGRVQHAAVQRPPLLHQRPSSRTGRRYRKQDRKVLLTARGYELPAY